MSIALSQLPVFGCVAALVFLICAGGQMYHGYLRTARSGPASRAVAIVYEAAWLVHMAIMCLACLGGSTGDFLLADVLPWANVLVVAVAAYTTFSWPDEGGMESDYPGREWMSGIEVMLACACLPLAAGTLGESWVWVIGIDCAYCAFRTAFLLGLDRCSKAPAASALAVAEAIKLLPEGLLYTDENGRTEVANDTMRKCLAAVGLPTDFAHVSDLWLLLGEMAKSGRSAQIAPDLFPADGKELVVQVGPGEYRLFTISGEHGAEPGKGRTHIVAFDISREVATLQEIDLANAELAASQDELVASLGTVQETAEGEALLQMRNRVHDVIGQRLSMLHRALEDEAVSDEELARLKPLLTDILRDLGAEAQVDPSVELAATVNAFALAGVTVRTQGTLPADPAKAKVYADCIREATTNAVKHARASLVDVSFGEDYLSVSNEGPLPDLPMRDGTGLAGMRRAARSVGMHVSIEALEQPFTIRLLPNTPWVPSPEADVASAGTPS